MLFRITLGFRVHRNPLQMSRKIVIVTRTLWFLFIPLFTWIDTDSEIANL